MGFQVLDINIQTGYAAVELSQKISKKLRIPSQSFTYTIERKSLDSRDKQNIHWKIRVGVSSPSLRGENPSAPPTLSIPYKKRDKKVVIIGSGPAGFFAGYVLLLAGFDVTLLEQGADVDTRKARISRFEETGLLDERSNYGFGEGGAGTFSDGKLTCRTKTISLERQFIFDSYIEAGAPAEIAYLSSPHLGSDNLVDIIKKLRESFIEKGGNILFNTKANRLLLSKDKQLPYAVDTDKGIIDSHYFVFATGHSSYETYRHLISIGVPFRVKPFAIGSRVEHTQQSINLSQWGKPVLPGVKAAEYKLTFNKDSFLPVYSFCMCPGGKVVPAAVTSQTNIVNGMSNYLRNSPYANAAIVAAVHLPRFLNKEISPLEALDWLEALERSFYDYSKGYAAPACLIRDFLEQRVSGSFPVTSYPLGLISADFDSLFPQSIVQSLREGITDFCRKIKSFDEGVMMGLESKTSSPIQAVRDEGGKSAGFENLYICGEGSGFAGGIISSGADGIKSALSILKTF